MSFRKCDHTSDAWVKGKTIVKNPVQTFTNDSFRYKLFPFRSSYRIRLGSLRQLDGIFDVPGEGSYETGGRKDASASLRSS